MAKNEIKITLTKEEAIILFELLSKYSETDKPDELQKLDSAEQNALWGLLSSLQKELVEPFLPDYVGILNAAKVALSTKE